MNIIITGASRGIGFDTALILAREGHQVLALSRNKARLAELAEQGGKNIHFLPFDLTHAMPLVLLEKLADWESVDVLINNAGWLVNKPFAALSDEDWQRSFDINFFGPIKLIRNLLPQLEQSPNAHIVNISSMGGFQGSSKFPGLAAYSASKAALANLTECLAQEFREKHINVNALALGAVQTEMLEQAFPGFAAPLTSEKMGSFVAWFSTQGHHFFNGQILPVSVSNP